VKTWELTIYSDGSAILADHNGNPAWSSQEDDEAATMLPDFITFEDGDDVASYLEDCEILPDGVELEIVESDDTGHVVEDDDEDEESDEGEDEE
jgi:hypothetical protein